MAKLTHTQQEIFSPEVQVMMKAGFLSPEGKITEDLTMYIRHLNFVAMKSKILARAKEIVEEQESDE